MCKAIVMVLLAVVSSSATAEWVEIFRDESYTRYYDPATVSQAGNMVKMWDLFDFKAAKVVDGKPFMSAKSQFEYDCMEQRMRSLHTSGYSGNMGAGEVVFSNSNPLEWRPIRPGAIGAKLMELACGKR